MRFRLLRRRLTISAPRMAVRSALPWPLRWVMVAIVLGFCAAIALWAFEFGREIAGLDTHSQKELLELRGEVKKLREERDRIQSTINTSDSLLAAERAAKAQLTAQIRALESDMRGMRDDLGFFENLLPASGADGVAIRGLQAELLGAPQAGTQVPMKWQVLVVLPGKNAPEFKGTLELVVSGSRAGKPWSMSLPGGPQALQFRQYRRLEGMVDLPGDVLVKDVTVKVMVGSASRAAQTVKLQDASARS
jgi:hypothetical protein